MDEAIVLLDSLMLFLREPNYVVVSINQIDTVIGGINRAWRKAGGRCCLINNSGAPLTGGHHTDKPDAKPQSRYNAIGAAAPVTTESVHAVS